MIPLCRTRGCRSPAWRSGVRGRGRTDRPCSAKSRNRPGAVAFEPSFLSRRGVPWWTVCGRPMVSGESMQRMYFPRWIRLANAFDRPLVGGREPTTAADRGREGSLHQEEREARVVSPDRVEDVNDDALDGVMLLAVDPDDVMAPVGLGVELGPSPRWRRHDPVATTSACRRTNPTCGRRPRRCFTPVSAFDHRLGPGARGEAAVAFPTRRVDEPMAGEQIEEEQRDVVVVPHRERRIVLVPWLTFSLLLSTATGASGFYSQNSSRAGPAVPYASASGRGPRGRPAPASSAARSPRTP